MVIQFFKTPLTDKHWKEMKERNWGENAIFNEIRD